MSDKRVKTAAQLKAEGVYSLLQMRLAAAQNLLRSVRQDHAEQCRLIALGAGGNVDGLVSRMREIEARILAMQPLLDYAEARVREIMPKLGFGRFLVVLSCLALSGMKLRTNVVT